MRTPIHIPRLVKVGAACTLAVAAVVAPGGSVVGNAKWELRGVLNGFVSGPSKVTAGAQEFGKVIDSGADALDV
jgi:hypothetical protein